MDICFGTPLLLLAVFLFAGWRAGIFKRHRHHYRLRCVHPFGMRLLNRPSAFYQCTQCAKSLTLPAHREMMAGLDYPARPPMPPMKWPDARYQIPEPVPYESAREKLMRGCIERGAWHVNGSGENAEYVRHVDPYRSHVEPTRPW